MQNFKKLSYPDLKRIKQLSVGAEKNLHFQHWLDLLFKNQLRKARFTALNKIIKIAQMTYANVDSIGGLSASSLTIFVAFIFVLY